MKIGIDARLYGTKHRGLGRYVKKLVDGLLEYDKKNKYVIFLSKDNFDEFNNSKAKKVLLDARWYSLKEQFLVPKIIKKEKLDLVHFPHFNVPLFFSDKYIVTFDDLIINHFPSSRSTTLPKWQYKIKLWGYKTILKHAVKTSKKIIVPTNFVKKDILSYYQVPAEKIEVTYEGYFLKDKHQPTAINHFNISKPYLLCVGAAYPHKNLERLVNVFKEFNSSNKFQLVLVGWQDYFYKRLKKIVKDYKDIIFTGYVSESELSGLYAKAVAYIYPTLHEGFGLPAIEAQAHSLPVVSSNTSSLPEVLADSAIYFNPKNDLEIKKSIEQVIADDKLRKILIAKGRENIKRFSWQKMIKETHNLYCRIS